MITYFLPWRRGVTTRLDFRRLQVAAAAIFLRFVSSATNHGEVKFVQFHRTFTLLPRSFLRYLCLRDLVVRDIKSTAAVVWTDLPLVDT